MTDAHDHGPSGAHALRLGAFAEAATAVLDSPSGCRTALFDALHQCWQSLQGVAGHLPPYVDDPREVVEHLERARTELGVALREAAARTAPTPGGPAARDTVPEGTGADRGERTERSELPERPERPEPTKPAEGTEQVDRVEQVEQTERTEVVGRSTEEHEAPAQQDPPGPAGSAGPVDLPNGHDGAAGPAAPAAADPPQAPDSPHTPEPPRAPSAPGEDGTPDATTHGGAEPTAAVATTRGTEPTAAVAVADPLTEFATALDRLEANLRREQVRYLPPPTQARRDDGGGDPAELVARTWRRVHMSLLRLPSAVAAEWRTTAAATAADAGHPVADEDIADLDVIVTGLPQDLCPAQRLPLDFTDLSAAAAEAPPKFHKALGLSAAELGKLPPGDPRPAWAVRAAQAVRLAALDPELQVALHHDHQPGSLATEESRDSYERRLTSLLLTAGQALGEKEGWPRENKLGAAHHLDMLLGGLVHKRPAAPDSWWYQWRTRVSRILAPLASEANYEVIIRPLEDLGRDFVRQYTIEESVKGVPGSSEPEVQWVVWTMLRRQKGFGPNKHKGRVVVRPAEPGTWR